MWWILNLMMKMGFNGYFARQLSNPHGFLGSRFITKMMNQGNEELEYFGLELMNLQGNEHILEIGFGNGRIMQEMSKKLDTGKIHGIDISEEMITLTKRRLRQEVKSGRVMLQKASVEHIPVEDNTFDKAFTCNTIYFWPDLEKCAQETLRVLKPGGIFYCGFRLEETMKRYPFVAEHRNIFKHTMTEEEVKRLFEKAGFSKVDIQVKKSEFVDSYFAVAIK